MNNDPNVFRITSALMGTAKLSDEPVLASLLATFSADSAFRPSGWGWDERERRPFDAGAIAVEARNKPLIGNGWFLDLYLHRQQAPKYWARINLGRKAGIYVELDKKLAPARFEAFFALADALAGIARPDIAVTHIWHDAPEPWPDDDARDTELMFRGAALAPVDYYRTGPCGLAMRTHLGPHFLRQFGDTRVRSLPVIVQEQPWGGVRLDLVPQPWKAPLGELLPAWRKAMDLLRPAEIFATPNISKNQFASWTRGARCEIGGVLPP